MGVIRVRYALCFKTCGFLLTYGYPEVVRKQFGKYFPVCGACFLLVNLFGGLLNLGVYST